MDRGGASVPVLYEVQYVGRYSTEDGGRRAVPPSTALGRSSSQRPSVPASQRPAGISPQSDPGPEPKLHFRIPGCSTVRCSTVVVCTSGMYVVSTVKSCVSLRRPPQGEKTRKEKPQMRITNHIAPHPRVTGESGTARRRRFGKAGARWCGGGKMEEEIKTRDRLCLAWHVGTEEKLRR
jgi:hypothetical protein